MPTIPLTSGYFVRSLWCFRIILHNNAVVTYTSTYKIMKNFQRLLFILIWICSLGSSVFCQYNTTLFEIKESAIADTNAFKREQRAQELETSHFSSPTEAATTPLISNTTIQEWIAKCNATAITHPAKLFKRSSGRRRKSYHGKSNRKKSKRRKSSRGKSAKKNHHRKLSKKARRRIQRKLKKKLFDKFFKFVGEAVKISGKVLKVGGPQVLNSITKLFSPKSKIMKFLINNAKRLITDDQFRNKVIKIIQDASNRSLNPEAVADLFQDLSSHKEQK